MTMRSAIASPLLATTRQPRAHEIRGGGLGRNSVQSGMTVSPWPPCFLELTVTRDTLGEPHTSVQRVETTSGTWGRGKQ